MPMAGISSGCMTCAPIGMLFAWRRRRCMVHPRNWGSNMAEPNTGDRIILKDLGFYGYHGVFAEEAKLGQRFFIDLELGVDLSAPATTDRLSTGISYADIYDV